MHAAAIALFSAALAAEPVAGPVQQAIQGKLARMAVEVVPGSIERATGPDSAPYRFFTYRDAQAGKVRGVAVSEAGEVSIANDPPSLGRFFAASKFFDRHGPADALEVYRILAQTEPVLDLDAIQRLPEEEKRAVYPARREAREGGTRVTGFVSQGEEIFRVQLDVTPARADIELKALGELLGRDEIDEAVRSLKSLDEILRAASAFELAEKKDPRAFAALVAALEDRSPNVRATVAQALARQVSLEPSRRAVAAAALQKALLREQDPMAKAALAEAAGSLAPAKPAKGK